MLPALPRRRIFIVLFYLWLGQTQSVQVGMGEGIRSTSIQGIRNSWSKGIRNSWNKGIRNSWIQVPRPPSAAVKKITIK